MFLLLSLLLPGQFVPSDDFSVHEQMQAFQASVRVIDWSDRGGRAGTGAIVGKVGDDLFVLTAFHVVDPGKRLELQCFDCTQYPKPVVRLTNGVEVLAKNPHADLALLRVRTDFTPPATLRIATMGPNDLAARVLTIGCNLGDAPTCTVDRLKGSRRLARENTQVRFWITQSTPMSGRSGGPLVDGQGLLIGVCRGFLTETSSLPAEGIYASLEEIHSLVHGAGLEVTHAGELTRIDTATVVESWPRKQDQLADASLASVAASREEQMPSPAD